MSVYNDQQHFTYRDQGGNLQDAWYGTDGWHLQQINDANRAGATVPGEYVAGDQTAPKAGVAAAGGVFVSVYNDQQHFVYLDAIGAIQDVWYGTDGWHLQQINEGGGLEPPEPVATNGPPAAGGLFVSVYNDQQHFTYLYSDPNVFPPQHGDIQDAWYGTDGWHLQQINGIDATVPNEFVTPIKARAASGDLLFVSIYNDQQHFTYQDLFGNIQDAWYGTDGWHLQQINGLA